MLLSSQFIFNTLGLISDDSLNDLSILQLLTNEIRIDAVENYEDEEESVNQQNFN